VERDQAATASKSLGVRFSQPGRYQPWKREGHWIDKLPLGVPNLLRKLIHSPWRRIPRFEWRTWDDLRKATISPYSHQPALDLKMYPNVTMYNV
jgi:hypothetical protein